MSILLPMTFTSFAQEMVMLGDGVKPATDKKSDEPKALIEFVAFTQKEELSQISDDMIDHHFLGDDIARKIYLFNRDYSYQESVAPGNSATKTILRKPVIYNSVKRIERDLKKRLKAGEISEENARSEFSRVLDVALNVANANTEGLEKKLESNLKPDKQLEIYLYEVKLKYIN